MTKANIEPLTYRPEDATIRAAGENDGTIVAEIVCDGIAGAPDADAVGRLFETAPRMVALLEHFAEQEPAAESHGVWAGVNMFLIEEARGLLRRIKDEKLRKPGELFPCPHCGEDNAWEAHYKLPESQGLTLLVGEDGEPEEGDYDGSPAKSYDPDDNEWYECGGCGKSINLDGTPRRDLPLNERNA